MINFHLVAHVAVFLLIFGSYFRSVTVYMKPKMSFIDVPADCDFSIHNLPYGVFSTASNVSSHSEFIFLPTPVVAVVCNRHPALHSLGTSGTTRQYMELEPPAYCVRWFPWLHHTPSLSSLLNVCQSMSFHSRGTGSSRPIVYYYAFFSLSGPGLVS